MTEHGDPSVAVTWEGDPPTIRCYLNGKSIPGTTRTARSGSTEFLVTGAVLNGDEKLAMGSLLASYNRIRRWGLRANGNELEQAVHVIQSFITQHMLQRVAPDHWSKWFDA